jgi:hypothetical protein
MMSDIPGWSDGIHDSIRAVSSLVGSKFMYMTTGPNVPIVRQLTAAYLARVRRLLVAMDVLYDAELPDVLGGELRVLVEAWVTGMWVHYSDSEAVDRLEADYYGRSNILIEAAKLPVPPFEIMDPNADWLPRIKDRTEAVERFLVAEADAAEGELLWSVYHLVYGGESLRNIHAGYAAVDRHLDVRPGWIGLHSERQDGNDGSGKLLWAATLLAMLARRVFKEFDLDTDELDALAHPIQRLGLDLNEAATE